MPEFRIPQPPEQTPAAAPQAPSAEPPPPGDALLPAVRLAKAPLWRRFAALVYDSFILAALSFAYGAALTLAGVLIQPNTAHDYQPMFDSAWVLVGWLGVLVAFYVYFWRRGGQTIGMKTWRLQLVDKTASPPPWVHLLARVAFAVPGLLLLGAGYFYRWLDAEGDCLHDRLSRTEVVVLPKG